MKDRGPRMVFRDPHGAGEIDIWGSWGSREDANLLTITVERNGQRVTLVVGADGARKITAFIDNWRQGFPIPTRTPPEE